MVQRESVSWPSRSLVLGVTVSGCLRLSNLATEALIDQFVSVAELAPSEKRNFTVYFSVHLFKL